MAKMVQGYPVCGTWNSRCVGHGADGRKPERMLPAARHRKRYEFAQLVFRNLPTTLTKCRFVISCYDLSISSDKDINLFPCEKSGIRYAVNKPIIDGDRGQAHAPRDASRL